MATTEVVTEVIRPWVGSLRQLLARPENRGFVQAFVSNVLILAVCTNSTVWSALSYANSVSPLLASLSVSLALQEDQGQNVKYILARTLAVSVGGAVGLLILYVTYYANGSSFVNSVTKGSVFTVLTVSFLTVLVYFFRPPVWTAKYKAVLIGGIAVCLVGGDGYWSGDQPLPLIYAYILLNMTIGLSVSYVVANTVLPIRKSQVVRRELQRAMGSLRPGVADALDAIGALKVAGSSIGTTKAPVVPGDVGATLVKCRVMLQASAYLEHRIWSCCAQFPVDAHLRLVVALRMYLSTMATMFDVLKDSSETISVSEAGAKVLRGLGDQIDAAFDFLVDFPPLSLEEECMYEDRRASLGKAIDEASAHLSRLQSERLRQTQGASRAAMALFVCLGRITHDMFPVVAACCGEVETPSAPSESESESETAMLRMTPSVDVLPEEVDDEFKRHRADVVSKTARKVTRLLSLKPALLKACLQATIALTTTCVLLVCTRSFVGLGEHALWCLITVWVFSSIGQFGAVVLKAINRVIGTAIAGVLAYALIYLTFAINGASYANRTGKYVSMTILYPLAMGALHREMIRAKPQAKYCFYVAKVTLSITTLATYGQDVVEPAIPAWRLLAVLIGILIEFVVKTLVFYRESATTMRHRIQDILQALARGGWRDPAWRAATASKVNDLATLQDLVLFEDRIAAALHAPLFDRRVINERSMTVIRRSLRAILNRCLTFLYVETTLRSLRAPDTHLSTGALHVDEAVRDQIHRCRAELIPSCLRSLAELFAARRERNDADMAEIEGKGEGGHEDAESPPSDDRDPFDELKSVIKGIKTVLVGRAGSNEGIAVLTWSVSVAAVGSTLANAMGDLRDYLEAEEAMQTMT